MRASRGLLATIGISTCLVLAGTLALLSVSAVVAFRGWPGLAPGVLGDYPTKLADVSVRPVPPRADGTRTGSVMLASVISPTSGTTSARTSGHALHGARSRDVAEAVHAPPHPPTLVAAVPTAPVVVRSPVSTRPHVREAVDEVTGGLGTAVDQAGNQLGNTVAETGGKLASGVQPISPELAVTLDRVTEAVGNVVRGLGGKVAGTVGSVSR
jgi:hypothetical protein